jgi:hypothetical protein
LDDHNPTQEQEKCLDLNAQATNILFGALSKDVFYKVCDLKSARDMCGSDFKKYIKDPTLLVMLIILVSLWLWLVEF